MTNNLLSFQLKPVRGRYIFEQPSHPEYSEAYGDGSDSLWSTFQAVSLTHNHRQAGGDRMFAELLNRVRVGGHGEEDLRVLQERVRHEGDPEIADCPRICATVSEVADYNILQTNKLEGRLYIFNATHFIQSRTNFTPLIDKAGRISDTNFLDVLKLKIGSRVMLIINIGTYDLVTKFHSCYFSLFSDVSDGLANGACGVLIAVEEHQDGSPNKLVVRFDIASTGEKSRECYPAFCSKYPGCTVIGRREMEYSLSRIKSVVSSTAKLVQYPLIPAFAITGEIILLEIALLNCSLLTSQSIMTRHDTLTI